jgi:hypothetical protein
MVLPQLQAHHHDPVREPCRKHGNQILLRRLSLFAISALVFLGVFDDTCNLMEIQHGMMEGKRALTDTVVESQDGSDLREAAVQAIIRTPGWHIEINMDKKVKATIKEMYMFAPREDYERLKKKYSEDPSSMSPPYHSLLHPSTIASLNIPPKESKHSYIRPYGAAQVIKTLSHFDNEAFILRYSGVSDRFSLYIPKPQRWNTRFASHARAVEDVLVPILREDHSDRFKKGQPEFSVVISTGDSLKMTCDCMSTPGNRESPPSFLEDDILSILSKNNKDVCNRYEFSAIWQFGSGFVNPEVMPTMVTLPPWNFQHLGCFQSFRFGNKVCSEYIEQSGVNPLGIYFGNHLMDVEIEGTSGEETEQHTKEIFLAQEKGRRLGEGAGETILVDSSQNQNGQNPEALRQKKTAQVPIYDYLRPQIIWRGTNFSFLNCLTSGYHQFKLTPQKIPGENNAEGFTKGLFEIWDTLTPRWKAVALTLEAESFASQERVSKLNFNEALPWIDAKFTDKHRSQVETDNWHHFLEMGGNVVAEYMDGNEAASFKYHIDFGGGGGTTWNGVKEKLALPGLLFHHHTPTYDWFHEDLIPWVHYIPISTELEDLKEKFDWAESHPEEAKSISDAATAFVRYMGTMEYWERIYDRVFVKRPTPSIEAYQPMEASMHSEQDDEKVFLELAKELGFPLKRLF